MLGCMMESRLLVRWEHAFINHSHRSRLRLIMDEKMVHLIELFPETLDFCFNILKSPGIGP